jgi:hypothetical protein
MIKAFKFRAQAIFSLLEKTPPWFTKFELEKFFYSSSYKYPKKLYISKTGYK